MAQATVVLASVRAHIGCVPSKTEGYVCPICLGPVHVQYPHCYSCKQLFIQGGAPEELADRIVPMSTALNPSTWYSHLSGYMDLPRIGGRLSACVFSLLPRAFGVRSFRCAGGAGE